MKLGYSNTSKAYRVFNRSTMTIEESIHVKFEESNIFVKNVVEIVSLGEDMERITLKDSPMQEKNKPKDDEYGGVQEVEAEPIQLLPKDWRYATNHPKELIRGDVSNGVTTRFKLHDICDHYAFISHIEPKNILEAKGDSYWLLAMQEELNQFERNQVWRLIPRSQDRLIIGTKLVFKNKLGEFGKIIRNRARLMAQGYNQVEGIDFEETFAPVA